ncbi:unnamed protein product [Larinioides sclopetarius]|uniref:Speckle-type POZ protein n=1 Tax=Larinioides sclopetarius TaxID=280406 RepID=A0AAV2BG49_9ARAC
MSADDCATFTWAINNYSYFWQKNGKAVVSPMFSIYMPEETKWKLILFPRGVSLNHKSVGFFLYRDKDCNGAENIEVEYSLDYLRSDGSFCNIPFTNEFQKDVPQGSLNYSYNISKGSKHLQQDILTLRCRLFRFNDKAVEMSNIFARTIFGAKELLSQLLIRNFNNLSSDQTQSFVIKSKSKDDIMEINLAVTNENEKNICFGINCIDQRVKYLAVKTFIIDSQMQKIDSGEHEYWPDSEMCPMFPLKFTKKEMIAIKSCFLPIDVLTFNFEFTISTGIVFEGIEKTAREYTSHPLSNVEFTISSGLTLEGIEKRSCEYTTHALPDKVTESWRKCISHENINDCPCALITDLTSLHEDQSTCDVKLKTKTNTFPVHTLILSARSPVFKAMFSNDMKEKTNGCVDVSDLQDETVRRFLLYLYTDQLEDLTWDAALQLFKAADKYAVISLRDKCSNFLKSSLNLENACEALLLSDLHQEKDLKESTQNFILKNAKVIFKSKEWKILVDNNSKLALETTLRNWNEE